MPPYLAGRGTETKSFEQLLKQEVITQNLIVTGLRGAGKTVLLTSFKPIAQMGGWFWAGTDMSETCCLTEEHIAIRLITDLAIVTTSLVIHREIISKIGFATDDKTIEYRLDHALLHNIYKSTPGLVVDKLKRVLEVAWATIKSAGKKGVVFAYDEAQTMSDHAAKEQYPLATLLQVFQSLQRQEAKFFLVLVGLPTLQSKLVESRTYSERMFHVETLDRLGEKDSRDAIQIPLETAEFSFTPESVNMIINSSGGYPYFIQFICREVYDLFVAGNDRVPITDIIAKLDADFFAGRWQRLTDRQRDLLIVAANLPTANSEFTVQEISNLSKRMLDRKFTPSSANQMLSSLSSKGLVFKNRHGKYSFAVPLLDQFILRQIAIMEE